MNCKICASMGKKRKICRKHKLHYWQIRKCGIDKKCELFSFQRRKVSSRLISRKDAQCAELQKHGRVWAVASYAKPLANGQKGNTGYVRDMILDPKIDAALQKDNQFPFTIPTLGSYYYSTQDLDKSLKTPII